MNILIVEDHQIVSHCFGVMLEDTFAGATISTTSCGREAIKLCMNNTYDVVLMDIDIENISGIEATKIISSTKPESKILIVSSYIKPELIVEAFHNGATGYLTKFASREEFEFAIKSVIQGKKYICSYSTSCFVSSYPGQNQPFQADRTDILSHRELTIAKLIASGKTSKEIADDLSISFTTVNRHRNNILKKLDIHNSRQLRSIISAHEMFAKDDGGTTCQQHKPFSGNP